MKFQGKGSLGIIRANMKSHDRDGCDDTARDEPSRPEHGLAPVRSPV